MQVFRRFHNRIQVNENARFHMNRLSSSDISVVSMPLPARSDVNLSSIDRSNLFPVLSLFRESFLSISAPKHK